MDENTNTDKALTIYGMFHSVDFKAGSEGVLITPRRHAGEEYPQSYYVYASDVPVLREWLNAMAGLDQRDPQFLSEEDHTKNERWQ